MGLSVKQGRERPWERERERERETNAGKGKSLCLRNNNKKTNIDNFHGCQIEYFSLYSFLCKLQWAHLRFLKWHWTPLLLGVAILLVWPYASMMFSLPSQLYCRPRHCQTHTPHLHNSQPFTKLSLCKPIKLKDWNIVHPLKNLEGSKIGWFSFPFL